jgi:hypothetical protein
MKPMVIFFDVFGIPNGVFLCSLTPFVGNLGPGDAGDGKSIAMDGGVFLVLGDIQVLVLLTLFTMKTLFGV